MNENLFSYLNKKQKFLLIFIPILIVSVILAFLVFSYFNQKSRQIEIIGLNKEAATAPNIDKTILEEQLKNVVLKNPDINEKDISTATIREGSYSEQTKDNVTTAHFIIDLDSIKQTYTVSFSWSDNVNIPNSTYIECPTLKENKYPDSKCIGMYTTSDSPELYLPYKGTTVSGLSYQISLKYYNGGGEYLEVSTKDCQNLEDAKKAAEEWLKTTPLKQPIEVKRFCI